MYDLLNSIRISNIRNLFFIFEIFDSSSSGNNSVILLVNEVRFLQFSMSIKLDFSALVEFVNFS